MGTFCFRFPGRAACLTVRLSEYSRQAFRGSILLHASASEPDSKESALLEKLLREDGQLGGDETYDPICGEILGMVDLVDCIVENASEELSYIYRWRLANPVQRARQLVKAANVNLHEEPQLDQRVSSARVALETLALVIKELDAQELRSRPAH